MLTTEAAESKREVSGDEESHFHLVIRVRHDEMAQWSQERLTTFFEAVGVLMAAKTQSKIPPRGPQAGADAARGRAAACKDESLGEVEQRIKRIEQTVEGVRRHVATLHESIAQDFKAFEDNLQSNRTAMSQTDDLVERVVEALEVLQSSTVRDAEGQSAPSVN